MTTSAFLASLPAILGIAGFVVYYLLRDRGKSSQITEQIVAKLRRDAPESANRIEGLSTRQVAKQLERDHDLRKLVTDQDFHLLTRVSSHQFIISLVVYGLIAVLFLSSVAAFVYLQTRPQPVRLTGWHLESAEAQAGGLAVDLDDLVLTWQASGQAADAEIFLENVQTLQRTPAFRVSTGEQRLVIPRAFYRDLLRVREKGQVNRLRGVARIPSASFTSPEFDVCVGITVMALPDQERSQVIIFAAIDNSVIPGYSFEAKLIVWKTPATDGLESFGGNINDSRGNFPVTNFSSLRWDTAKVSYFGPDDPKLVRCVTK